MAEHGRYEYSPVWDREFELPNNKTIALCVVPNVEHFRFDMPYPSDSSDYVPDVLKYTWRTYGSRVGIWRLMDILDDYGIRATVALNAEICDHEPEIVEEGMKRDWEFMGHGVTNSKRLSNLDEEEERTVIQATRDRIADFTGVEPDGWLGPGVQETFNTPDLLAEEGFEYVCDWRNDDQPYPMNVRNDDLVAMPCSAEIDDIPMLTRRNLSGPQFERTVKDQFDVLYEESQEDGNNKVLSLEIHPYLTGQAHRSKYLDNILHHITAHDGVWKTTHGEIADHYKSEYMC
jgi:allantoinase